MVLNYLKKMLKSFLRPYKISMRPKNEKESFRLVGDFALNYNGERSFTTQSHFNRNRKSQTQFSAIKKIKIIKI
ncbi:hypothetical protein BpHYR1_031083 [Brachionus plicatilis]|uniref:Uncharacterized protein n=1 Tax=Brachionus plicatilis TaxID=10195 RepID=A0A3M7RHW0_BRAPC|nr:hypothetical protein BpHYR1_031083 [Brachionus plicatilis]